MRSTGTRSLCGWACVRRSLQLEDEPRARSVICCSCSKRRTNLACGCDEVVHRVEAGAGCERGSMSLRR